MRCEMCFEGGHESKSVYIDPDGLGFCQECYDDSAVFLASLGIGSRSDRARIDQQSQANNQDAATVDRSNGNTK